jgi:hypothetical protein
VINTLRLLAEHVQLAIDCYACYPGLPCWTVLKQLVLQTLPPWLHQLEGLARSNREAAELNSPALYVEVLWENPDGGCPQRDKIVMEFSQALAPLLRQFSAGVSA